MYITVKSVFNFSTNGINFLLFVCFVIIAFKISESSCTQFIRSISSSVIYLFNFQYNINSSSEILCNLRVKSSKNPSLFFVNSSFISCTALYKKCLSING